MVWYGMVDVCDGTGLRSKKKNKKKNTAAAARRPKDRAILRVDPGSVR